MRNSSATGRTRRRHSLATLNPPVSLPLRSHPRPHARTHPWRVLHACHSARLVSAVIDSQAAVGMRPYVVTHLPAESNPGLLRAWSEVRRWDRQLHDAGWVEVIHAHQFAAGMAGVRGYVPCVYDLSAFCDAATPAAANAWLARSFHAAEQFVLNRADAVVVHSSRMRAACRERGVDAASLFLVPEPVANEPVAVDPRWLANVFGLGRDNVSFFADLTAGYSHRELASAPAALESLLQGFTQLAAECEGARLFLAAGEAEAAAAQRIAACLEISEKLFVLSPNDALNALASADVVIATTANTTRFSLRALMHARCLLAADTPDHRDTSAHGRGCLWFLTEGEAGTKDLANRGAFLARNPDFRFSLAESGLNHVLATRSPEKIGKAYDKVYRHAVARKNSGSRLPEPAMQLKPASLAA